MNDDPRPYHPGGGTSIGNYNYNTLSFYNFSISYWRRYLLLDDIMGGMLMRPGILREQQSQEIRQSSDHLLMHKGISIYVSVLC